MSWLLVCIANVSSACARRDKCVIIQVNSVRMIATTRVSEMFVFYDWQVQWTVRTSQLMDQWITTACNTIMTQVLNKRACFGDTILFVI
jgi:hypothetical protein